MGPSEYSAIIKIETYYHVQTEALTHVDAAANFAEMIENGTNDCCTSQNEIGSDVTIQGITKVQIAKDF